MRLPDFILANIEPILAEWERFARTLLPGGNMDQLALRDHAESILRATVRDMQTEQTPRQQQAKSEGDGEDHRASRRLDQASDEHAATRVLSGFDLVEVVAEYRTLRASVIRLWRQSQPDPDVNDLEDLIRFNESIDQSLTRAVQGYTERIDRAREMFLAILGHDLRNPLNAMVVAGKTIELMGADHAAIRSAAAQINRSAGVISRMINDLLDYTTTRLGSGMQINPAPMDLGRLCQEVVAEYRSTHPQHELQYHFSGDLQGVWDASRLRQAISNLLGNALQYGESTQPIHLRVEPQDGQVVITVQNGGAAIPPEVIGTLFSPLVRGPANGTSTGEGHRGFGLGLYIARQVVLVHDGTIDVTSSEAEGTTFTICLPRQANPGKAEPSQSI